MAAHAPADGYTLFMGTISTLATNVSMYSKLPYDPVRDFAPITLAGVTPYLVAVHPSVPVTSLRDLIALAKAQPGKLNFATSGSGGGSHLSVELFKFMAGIDLVQVPYKGAAPAMNDVLAGQVQMVFSQPATVLPHYQAGKLKVLASTGARRLPALPDLPTVAESGVPGYTSTSWQGVLAPAGLPAAIIDRLHHEIGRALAMPEMRERLAREGSESSGMSPQQFALFIRSEIAKWAKVVKESGAKAD
jgi:tripartite-type tricarboxylate transporter receptor subunit TctC